MTIEMEGVQIPKKCRAIVMFGAATDTSGTRPAEYYQVTIDPEMVSPSGLYIRFGTHQNDEITGWQRIGAMTVCEILGEYADDGTYPEAPPGHDLLVMRKVV